MPTAPWRKETIADVRRISRTRATQMTMASWVKNVGRKKINDSGPMNGAYWARRKAFAPRTETTKSEKAKGIKKPENEVGFDQKAGRQRPRTGSDGMVPARGEECLLC